MCTILFLKKQELELFQGSKPKSSSSSFNRIGHLVPRCPQESLPFPISKIDRTKLSDHQCLLKTAWWFRIRYLQREESADGMACCSPVNFHMLHSNCKANKIWQGTDHKFWQDKKKNKFIITESKRKVHQPHVEILFGNSSSLAMHHTNLKELSMPIFKNPTTKN